MITTNKKYKLILADPPWSYDNKNTGGGDMNGGAAANYQTMSIEDICKMDIQSIAEKDSCLFLWTTTPLLQEGLDVMKAWGFKYKTAIYWRKIMSLGMGFWFRGQVETCLFGIRGKIKAFRSQKTNFIQDKVRKHSQKPDALYGMIESLDLNPKIELFARNRRTGWDAWGNEISDTIQQVL